MAINPRYPRRRALLLGGLAALTACAGPTNNAQVIAPSPMAPKPAVQWIGRVEPLGPTSGRFSFSGSGFRARFRGTGVALQLADAGNWFTIVLDGTEAGALVTTKEQSRYHLAQGLPPGRHTVEVYRRTEALFGPTELQGVFVDSGELLAPPAPQPLFEFVGDSISAGYGNEGASPDCKFSADTENHFLAYPAIVARAFGAENSTVAWSGRGVVKNYNGESGELVPTLYERTLAESPEPAWVPTRSATAVIINLGNNDYSTHPDPGVELFSPAYEALLKRVRANNPAAFILCTIGPTLGGQDRELAAKAIERAIAGRVAAGDARVAFYALTTSNTDPGCDWHPSVKTHALLAAELIEQLRLRGL